MKLCFASFIITPQLNMLGICVEYNLEKNIKHTRAVHTTCKTTQVH